MSTRSNIARENPDGSYDCVYCHWDGYPSHNGAILLEPYSDPAKLGALLGLGNLSSLGPEIGDAHDFEAGREGVCTFYGRDRGEEGEEAVHFASAEELGAMLKEAWTEWLYVFRASEGRWYYTNTRPCVLRPIPDACAED